MDSNTALRLLRSGAITDQQYKELTERAPEVHSDPTETPPEQSGTRTKGLLQTAAAAGAGAVMGSLAADLIKNAISDPTPEVFEATFAATTVWTEGGYITQGEITWENAEGEVIAEGDFTEAGTWEETSSVQDDNDAGFTAGDDAAGFEEVGGLDFF